MLLTPLYLGPVSYYSAILSHHNTPVFDVHQHYQKQSYVNRTTIYGANGALNLIIPIQHVGQKFSLKEAKIAHDYPWRKQHVKSFISAYRTSAYFEFFEDDFIPLIQKKETFLLDYTYALHHFIMGIISAEPIPPKKESTTYLKETKDDYRNVFHPKQKQNTSTPYPQVFENKHGFISDLSIVDLIFNLGNKTSAYL